MTILVLGGTLYMGRHLVNELISAGHDITIATRGKTSDSFEDKVKRLVIDRHNPDILRAAFKNKSYDLTIDNIAYSSNDVRFLLDSLQTKKYIMTSTVSVYSNNLHENMHESEMDAERFPVKWCDEDDFPYDEAKRQAEAALFQAYSEQPSAAVRFPYIFGKDDYTKRLFFYVEHVFHERAMHIDNLDARLSFINSLEAGRFLAYAATESLFGPINASSNSTISLEEIIRYVESRISKKAIIQESGEIAPLNGVPSFSMDTHKAAKKGFKFLNIDEWVYPLIDFWIDTMS